MFYQIWISVYKNAILLLILEFLFKPHSYLSSYTFWGFFLLFIFFFYLKIIFVFEYLFYCITWNANLKLYYNHLRLNCIVFLYTILELEFKYYLIKYMQKTVLDCLLKICHYKLVIFNFIGFIFLVLFFIYLFF